MCNKLFVLSTVLGLAASAALAAAQAPNSTAAPPVKTNRGVKPSDKPQIVTPATTTAQRAATRQNKNQLVGRRHRPKPFAHDGNDARKDITVEVKNQNVSQVRNQAGTENKFVKSTTEIGAPGTKNADKRNQANSNNGKPPVVVGFADGAPDKPYVQSAAQTHALPSPTPTPSKRGTQPLKK